MTPFNKKIFKHMSLWKPPSEKFMKELKEKIEKRNSKRKKK